MIAVLLPSAAAALSAPASPGAALQSWREARINGLGAVFDASRYHAQVLIVDDDGLRARTAESLLERVAIWADAGWWIYPHACSLGNPTFDKASLRNACAPLDLPANRLLAPLSSFDVSDVTDGGYDLILCVDTDVQQRVRALVRQEAGDDDDIDATVLSLCDFLAIGGDRIDALDDELRSLVARQSVAAGGAVGSLVELPRAYPSHSQDWARLVAASALCSAGLVTFLKAEFDDFFVGAFNELLEVWYRRPEDVGVGFAECEEAMRRYIVTGGLTLEQRQELFEAHRERLRERFAEAA